MKKILITAFALSLAVPALAAQQDIAQISAVTASREALRTAVNTQLSAVQANFDEVYAAIDAGPVYVNVSAPADTKVVWIDTDQDNAIKVYVGGVWTVVGSGGDGIYTLPTAAADTLGGIKVGARLTITDGVLSADVQAGGESTTVGDGTTGPYLDGTVDGGTLIKLSAPSGGNGTWTSLQGGNPTANRNWRLPIDAPPAAGTTRLINVDENTQMGLVDPATFLTPTGSADLLTITDTGTYFATDTVGAALQELGSELADVTEITLDASLTETGGVLSVTNPVTDYDTDGDGDFTDESWFPAAGIGGSTGSTDNAILRANGTGGSTAQASGVTIDDNDNLATSGTIKGRTLFNSYAADQTLTAATHNSTVVQATEPIEITLWDCEAANVGDTVLLWARDAEKIEVAPATGDGFALFDGTPLTAGNELDVAATKGTKVTLMCTADDTWSVFHETATTTDGGAAD